MGGEDFNVDFPSLLPDQPVFLYELNGLGGGIANLPNLTSARSGGSVGLSPHPVAWSNFLSLYGSHLGSCPPHLGCPKNEHGILKL